MEVTQFRGDGRRNWVNGGFLGRDVQARAGRGSWQVDSGTTGRPFLRVQSRRLCFQPPKGPH